MEEEKKYKDIYAKVAAMYKEVSKIQFQRDQALDGVVWVSEQEILSKIRPLFAKYDITPFPDMDIISTKRTDKRGKKIYGSYLKLSVELYDSESGTSRMVSSIHKEWEEAPFGSTITLAEKYLYKTMFNIETYDDNSANIQNIRDKARSEAEKKDWETDPLNPENKLGKNEEIKSPVVGGDNLSSIMEVVKQELPVVESKKEDPKTETVAATTTTPVVNEEAVENDYRESRNKGYDVKLAVAKDDTAAYKELNKSYGDLKEKLELHPDYTNLGYNFRNITGYLGVKTTNAQIRKYLIEFRLGGFDAMISLIAADCNVEVDAAKKILIPEEPTPVSSSENFKKTEPNSKAHPDITDQPKEKVINDGAIPAGTTLNREARIDFLDLIPGQMRAPMEGVRILNQMRAIGIGEEHILWYLSEDSQGLGLKFPYDKKGVAMDLARCGTKLDLESVVSYIQKNHP